MPTYAIVALTIIALIYIISGISSIIIKEIKKYMSQSFDTLSADVKAVVAEVVSLTASVADLTAQVAALKAEAGTPDSALDALDAELKAVLPAVPPPAEQALVQAA